MKEQQNKNIVETLKNIIISIVNELVMNPNQVKIHTSQTQALIIYEIETAKDDLKFVIGEKGVTIQAIRNIARAIAKKNKKNVQVEVIQP
jgi:predicted RNA-binding protein YlqC (UPF0109 family)